MKTITLRLDEQLHKQFKIKSITEGITMQDYLVELVKKALEQK